MEEKHYTFKSHDEEYDSNNNNHTKFQDHKSEIIHLFSTLDMLFIETFQIIIIQGNNEWEKCKRNGKNIHEILYDFSELCETKIFSKESSSISLESVKDIKDFNKLRIFLHTLLSESKQFVLDFEDTRIREIYDETTHIYDEIKRSIIEINKCYLTPPHSDLPYVEVILNILNDVKSKVSHAYVMHDLLQQKKQKDKCELNTLIEDYKKIINIWVPLSIDDVKLESFEELNTFNVTHFHDELQRITTLDESTFNQKKINAFMILYDNVDDTWKYVESCIYRQILFDYFKKKTG